MRTRGYDKFSEANANTVNEVVNEERENSGVPYTQHAAMFQKTMSSKWKELTSSEHDEWDRLAIEEKKEGMEGVFM